MNWRELLQPVRPPLDPDVLALSDREKDILFGAVKAVREFYEFTSAANPEWNAEWANRPESIFDKWIIYDVNGMKVSDVDPPRCALGGPQKMIYDTKGRRIEVITYNRDGTVYRRALSFYDLSGWLVETDYYESGDAASSSRWVYEYVLDSHGNWISQIPRCMVGCPRTLDNGLQCVKCRSLTYYE